MANASLSLWSPLPPPPPRLGFAFINMIFFCSSICSCFLCSFSRKRSGLLQCVWLMRLPVSKTNSILYPPCSHLQNCTVTTLSYNTSSSFKTSGRGVSMLRKMKRKKVSSSYPIWLSVMHTAEHECWFVVPLQASLS